MGKNKKNLKREPIIEAIDKNEDIGMGFMNIDDGTDNMTENSEKIINVVENDDWNPQNSERVNIWQNQDDI